MPIALGTGQFDVLEQFGKALADVVAAQSDPILIVASSDMNHYESDVVTRAKDHRAIERILTLDPRGLFDVVTQQNISMCGFGPAVVMLTAARQLGAKSAELVKYATSGMSRGIERWLWDMRGWRWFDLVCDPPPGFARAGQPKGLSPRRKKGGPRAALLSRSKAQPSDAIRWTRVRTSVLWPADVD